MSHNSTEFLRLLTSSQRSLQAWIYVVVPDRAAALDVLQDTNVTLLQKAEEFVPGTSFMAWACQIARFHILTHRRKASRERQVLDDDVFASLCDLQKGATEEGELRLDHLKECLARLPEDHRSILARRYAPGGSVAQLASERGQSPNAVSQLLFRIRESLQKCLAQRMREGRP